MSTPTADVKTLKTALRQQMRARRLAFAPEECTAASEEIRSRAIEVLRACRAGRVAIFLATSGEPDIDDLSRVLRSNGWKVFAPYFSDEAHSFHEIEPEGRNIVEACFGNICLRAPVEYSGTQVCNARELDVVFIPGLAFDEHGNRLGQGGGWYDRVLANAPCLMKIGVAFDFQVVADLPCEAHDQQMNFVITEKRIIETRN